MKRFINIICAALTVFSAATASGQEPIEEIILVPSVEERPGFNAPELVPVQVYLLRSDQKILIVPRIPLGVVTVCIDSFTSGSSADSLTVVADDTGTITAPSCLGTYRILLTLPNGRLYQGEFNIN